MSSWAWLIWLGVGAAALLTAVAGGLLLAFAIAGQRSIARVRGEDEPHGCCDCCGYPLAGLEDGFCPECGWTYADNRRVPVWRRIRAAAAGVALLLIAAAGAFVPHATRHGAASLIPNIALIAALPIAPVGDDGLNRRAAACAGGWVHRQLQARADGERLSSWDRAFLASRCVRTINGARSERVREAAAQLLASVAGDGSAVLTGMLSALDDGSPTIRGRMVAALAQLGASDRADRACHTQVVQRLMGAAVCDRDDIVRRQAVEALAQLSRIGLPPAAAGVYARTARDPSPQVRARTLYAMYSRPLMRSPGSGDLATVTIASHDQHATVREAAVCALGRLAESLDGAVLLLGVSLRDQSVEVRQSAAGCLARLGRKAAPAWPSLIAGLDDADAGVRASVVDALGAIRG